MTKPRVLNHHRDGFPNDAINIMRPGPWGNRHRIRKGCTHEQAVARHRADVLNSPMMQVAIKRELRGCDLVCCCKPKSCHGDIYIEVANVE